MGLRPPRAPLTTQCGHGGLGASSLLPRVVHISEAQQRGGSGARGAPHGAVGAQGGTASAPAALASSQEGLAHARSGEQKGLSSRKLPRATRAVIQDGGGEAGTPRASPRLRPRTPTPGPRGPRCHLRTLTRAQLCPLQSCVEAPAPGVTEELLGVDVAKRRAGGLRPNRAAVFSFSFFFF